MFRKVFDGPVNLLLQFFDLHVVERTLSSDSY
jgi:hypothetical protein